ncbi:hypothetical protein EV121DRAFT_288272 [Schizophyllum commune]
MASVACDLHGPQPFRPPLSLGDEPLSAVDADSVRSAEAKAAVVVKEWLAFSADSQITDAAFNKAFRAILRILMSYGDEASLSGRPDSLNVVAPKEALCNSLILYISAHSLQKPFLHPYVEAEILSSLLAAPEALIDTARIVSVAIEHLCVDPRDLDSREGQFLIEIQAISSQFEREPSMQSLGKALALQLDQYKGARTFM